MFGIRKIRRLVLEIQLKTTNANKYIDGKLTHQENQIKALQESYKKLEDRIWLLENPPKYKVGQAVKGMIITSVEVMDYKTFIHLGNPEMNFYDLLNKNAQNRESNIFNRKAWQYKAIKKGMTEPIVLRV